jgi:hypothetical protein
VRPSRSRSITSAAVRNSFRSVIDRTSRNQRRSRLLKGLTDYTRVIYAATVRLSDPWIR